MKWGLFVNSSKKNAIQAISTIIDFAKKHTISVLGEQQVKKIDSSIIACKSKRIGNEVDYIFSVGGDGTFLRVAREMQQYNKPIIGVNAGNLGFLAELSQNDITIHLQKLLQGTFSIEKRMLLASVIKKSEKNSVELATALNDIVISKKDISRVMKAVIYINEQFVTEYTADGLIVCTPTGSTAYSLSAGGPVVTPEARIVCITPICPHTLTHRPLIVSAADSIRVVIKEPHRGVFITVDGQVGYPTKIDNSLYISVAENKVQMVRFKNISYFDLLREKLHWGHRSRNAK